MNIRPIASRRAKAARTGSAARAAPGPAPSLEKALLALRAEGEAERFLIDLCTPAEITALRERWLIAQLLDEGLSYRAIVDRLGTSVTTVSRVARFLQKERHCGYRLVLDRLRKKSR